MRQLIACVFAVALIWPSYAQKEEIQALDCNCSKLTDVPLEDCLIPEFPNELTSSRRIIQDSCFRHHEIESYGFTRTTEYEGEDYRIDVILTWYSEEDSAAKAFVTDMMDHCYGEFWSDATRESVRVSGTRDSISYKASFRDGDYHGGIWSYMTGKFRIVIYSRGFQIDDSKIWLEFTENLEKSEVTVAGSMPNK
jgi:hypothetical protein